MPGTQPHIDPIRSAFAELATWSETLPCWQRDALRRIYGRCSLTQQDVDQLEALCRVPHGLQPPDVPAANAKVLARSDLPAVVPTNASVSLVAVGEAQNVNALARNQTLKFGATGLTI